MRILAYIILCCLSGPFCRAYDSQTDLQGLQQSVSGSSLEALESRRKAIGEELGELARFAMNSGIGRIGYRSLSHTTSDEEEWIEIDFGAPTPIDLIALVPVLWRDAERGFIADAFPEAFEISAGLQGSEQTIVIAEFDEVEGIMPRMAPFIIDCPGAVASWIRITAKRLSPRKFDGLFIFQLSEVLVFNGHKNVALGKRIRTSSSSVAGSGAWNEAFVNDGSMPYLMDSAGGGGSLAFTNDSKIGQHPSFSIDLGAPVVVDHLILHVVEQADTVPQAFAGDFGVPFQFILEGSLSEDFQNPIALFEFKRDNILDVSPILSMDLDASLCRYVRLTATRPYVFRGMDEEGVPLEGNRLGFAEIELLSNGKNVALGKRVESSFDLGSSIRKIETLTDGKNLYGQILSIREWVIQLAIRHDLEVELPLVSRELELRYDRQKKNLYRLKLSLGSLVLVAVILVLFSRSRQQRALFKTRERITADLHDVLGGNISAIVLLGQLARSENQDPEETSGYLRRIETLAVRTRNALKYISDMLNQSGLYQNLLAEMQRIAKGLTEGLEHELQHTGDEFISQIHQKKRIDIFLFYKECLVNIIRHSHATRIETRLNINPQLLELQVCDNGIGLPGNESPVVPPSLRRRARILGAKVTASRISSGGTCIRMTLKWKQSWPMRVLKGLPFFNA